MKKESVKPRARLDGGLWYIWTKGRFPGKDYACSRKLGDAYRNLMINKGLWAVKY